MSNFVIFYHHITAKPWISSKRSFVYHQVADLYIIIAKKMQPSVDNIHLRWWYTPVGNDIPLLLQWIKKDESKSFRLFFGGDKGTRIPDLLNAIQALYQLSYTPMCFQIVTQFLFVCNKNAQTFYWLFQKWKNFALCLLGEQFLQNHLNRSCQTAQFCKKC